MSKDTWKSMTQEQLNKFVELSKAEIALWEAEDGWSDEITHLAEAVGAEKREVGLRAFKHAIHSKDARIAHRTIKTLTAHGMGWMFMENEDDLFDEDYFVGTTR